MMLGLRRSGVCLLAFALASGRADADVSQRSCPTETVQRAFATFAEASGATGSIRIEKAKLVVELLRDTVACDPCYARLALTLGKSLEYLRRFVEAEDAYVTFLRHEHDSSCQPDKSEFPDALRAARYQLAELPKFEVSVTPSDAVVTVDGRLLSELRDRMDTRNIFRLEPGPHDVRATVGRAETSQHLELQSSDPLRVVELRLPVACTPWWTCPKTIGVVVGSVGIAAIATGAVFGALASSAKTDYERHCGNAAMLPSGWCTEEGVTGHDDASTKATFSNVFFVGGVVAASVGTTLFLWAPDGVARAAVGMGRQGAFVRGEF